MACEQLIQSSESWTYAFPIDVYKGGAGTSINMNSNEVLANLALEHLSITKGKYDFIFKNDHINKYQSTNHVYPMALRFSHLLMVLQP